MFYLFFKAFDKSGRILFIFHFTSIDQDPEYGRKIRQKINTYIVVCGKNKAAYYSYDVVRLESCKNKLMSRGLIFLWIYSSQELMLTVESTVALAIFPQFHLCMSDRGPISAIYNNSLVLLYQT
jgi:hypothetical protein